MFFLLFFLNFTRILSIYGKKLEFTFLKDVDIIFNFNGDLYTMYQIFETTDQL